MPGVKSKLDDDAEKRETSTLAGASVQPEDEPVYLPSTFAKDGVLEDDICSDSAVAEKEAVLRGGQCGDAIKSLRAHLIAQRQLINYRNAHVVGQPKVTRSAQLIADMGARIDDDAERYRCYHTALHNLKGAKGCGPFQELLPGHVKLFNPAESDKDSLVKLGNLGQRAPRITGSGNVSARHQTLRGADPQRDLDDHGKREITWIWTADGGPDDTEERYVHEGAFLSIISSALHTERSFSSPN